MDYLRSQRYISGLIAPFRETFLFYFLYFDIITLGIL